MTRIFLLEDEDFMIERICDMLNDHFPGVEVSKTDRADVAIDMIAAEPFDCLVLDRNVIGGDGLEVLRTIRDSGIETPAIILSNLNEIEHRTDGLDVGADDYVGKNSEPRELAARIRAAIRRGNTQAHPKILKRGNLALHRVARKAEWSGRNLKLTPKQFGVLLCVAEAMPEPVHIDHIWKKTWDDYRHLPTQKAVIHTNVSRLRDKLTICEGLTIVGLDQGYSLKID